MEDELIFVWQKNLEGLDARYIHCDGGSINRFPSGDWYTLLFVLRGRVFVYSRNLPVRVENGYTYLLTPCSEESFTVEAEGGSEYYTLAFTIQQDCGTESPFRMEIPSRVHIKTTQRLTYLLRRYIELQYSGHGSEATKTALILLVLKQMALSSLPYYSLIENDTTLEFIANQVDEYIAAHYRESIGSIDIAMELHYNVGYLERVYRQKRSVAIREALYNRRVREVAAQLLLNKNKSIEDIAKMCGFVDMNFFRRLFKRQMLSTPHQYRLKYGIMESSYTFN